MESVEVQAEGRSSGEFVESSILDTCVPLASSTSLQELLAPWDRTEIEHSQSLLPFIAERETVFFDELIPVYVVLRTPYIEENTLKSYLSRLVITLESHVTSTVSGAKAQGEPGPPTKEILASETVQDSAEPVVVVSKSQESTGQGHAHLYLIWRRDIFLGHPRTRSSRPAVYFTALASLRPAEVLGTKVTEDEYMHSLEPSPPNLLHAFADDPGLAGLNPKLSASRVTKISLSAPLAKELLRPIRNAPRRLFKAVPAFIWRIRYSRWQSSSTDSALIASLDIEATSFSSGPIRVKSAELVLSGGQVVPYSISERQDDNCTCNPGEQVTKLFGLIPSKNNQTGSSESDTQHHLDLKINGEVSLSDHCSPIISVEWRTSVEFPAGLKLDTGKAHHNVERASLDTGPLESRRTALAPTMPNAPGPDSLPAVDEPVYKHEERTMSDISMTLTITGPATVRMGKIFYWSVFMVNRSEKPRRLALLIVPRRKRNESRWKETHQSSGSHSESTQLGVVARAIVDENVVYAKQRNARIEAAELVCLSTDVRIGPLAPLACYNMDLAFLPLCAGELGIEALRLVDMASQEFADVRKLPSIVSLNR